MGERAIIPSATLLLVRDTADGLEVFMVKRNTTIDFMPGAMVFPGGKVDPADSDPALTASWRHADGRFPEAVTARVAAIRESFEECGILLARERGSDALLDETRTRSIDAKHRAALCRGERNLAAIVAEEDLELAGDLPAHFAHWITPEMMPRRFDTHFFLVEAPAGQSAVHDGDESVDSAWITPQQAIAEEAAERLSIIFPTLMQLRKLARHASVADALAASRAEPVVTVLPHIEEGEDGPTLRIPIDAGYGVGELSLEAFSRKLPAKPD